MRLVYSGFSLPRLPTARRWILEGFRSGADSVDSLVRPDLNEIGCVQYFARCILNLGKFSGRR